MALIPANPRDRVFGGVALVSLLLVGAYYLYVWQPKGEELNVTQQRVDTLLVINQRAKAELAQGRTAQLKAEAERYAGDLEVMRHLVPTGNEVPALLDQVSTAARRVGLDIADVQPLPLMSGDQYDAYKYRLSMRGAYHQIGLLLANIGSMQRIVAPINLILTPASNATAAEKRGQIQPVEAQFEIQTYVSRMTSVAAPKVAKPDAEPAKPGER